MIRDISRKYYEIWGNEEAQNSFLKGLLVVLASLFFIQSIALTILALRKPDIIAVSETETAILTKAPPSDVLLETELKRIVSRYALAHYYWDVATIDEAHRQAAHYVASSFQKSFVEANAQQVKIAKEKKLSQKVYVSNITDDPQALTARVTLDRILQVDGLRVATPLVLDLTLQSGPRTNTNPEGLYITGEKIVP
jgi:hypothetical protein